MRFFTLTLVFLALAISASAAPFTFGGTDIPPGCTPTPVAAYQCSSSFQFPIGGEPQAWTNVFADGLGNTTVLSGRVTTSGMRYNNTTTLNFTPNQGLSNSTTFTDVTDLITYQNASVYSNGGTYASREDSQQRVFQLTQNIHLFNCDLAGCPQGNFVRQQTWGYITGTIDFAGTDPYGPPYSGTNPIFYLIPFSDSLWRPYEGDPLEQILPGIDYAGLIREFGGPDLLDNPPAVPEPATYALCAAGLIALGWRRYRSEISGFFRFFQKNKFC